MSPPRCYIIVPGAWQNSRGWQAIADLLNEAGHQVHLIDLPGHGIHSGALNNITLQSYVEAVAQHIAKIPTTQQKILIGHSMAGMVISQVIERISVDNLVYIAAFLPETGESIRDLVRHNTINGLRDFIVVEKNLSASYLKPEGLAAVLFNGCDANTAKEHIAQLEYQPLQPERDPALFTPEKLEKIPKDYIECLQDNTLSLAFQRYMHQRYDCRVHQLDSDHCPFLSTPDLLANILLYKLIN